MMFGWNLCSALGLKFIYKHNIFFFFLSSQLNQTPKRIQLKPANACSNYIRNSISKWAVYSGRAFSSSHWQFTSPAFLKELKQLSTWCQIHSEKCWCSLILHALGSKLGLGCVRTSELLYHNQFCAALFSYTTNKQSHTDENSEMFLARSRIHLRSVQLEQ